MVQITRIQRLIPYSTAQEVIEATFSIPGVLCWDNLSDNEFVTKANIIINGLHAFQGAQLSSISRTLPATPGLPATAGQSRIFHNECKERDSGCIVTGFSAVVDVAHIISLAVSSQPEWWDMLEVLLSATAYQEVRGLLQGPCINELPNLILLDPTMRRMFDEGKLSLAPDRFGESYYLLITAQDSDTVPKGSITTNRAVYEARPDTVIPGSIQSALNSTRTYHYVCLNPLDEHQSRGYFP